jgi:hypothetical protein
MSPRGSLLGLRQRADHEEFEQRSARAMQSMFGVSSTDYPAAQRVPALIVSPEQHDVRPRRRSGRTPALRGNPKAETRWSVAWAVHVGLGVRGRSDHRPPFRLRRGASGARAPTAQPPSNVTGDRTG